MTYRFFWLFFIFSSSGCFKKLEVKSVLVSEAAVETTVSTVSSGTVEAEQQAVLSFGIQGRVQKILVKLGERVKKDQLLSALQNDDLEAIFRQSERDLSNAEKLFADGLTSKTNLNEIKKNYEVAKSNFEKSEIRAPFAGIVGELNLQVGEVVGPAGTKALIRVVDEKDRIIKGQIDELDLAKVKSGALARVRVQSLQKDPLLARVTQVVPFISTTKEQERTAQVELLLVNHESVPVGASADIEIVVEKKDKTVAVPTRAILGTQNQRYVYKILDGKLTRTDLEVGLGNYDTTEVIKGLNLGEEVALPGENLEMKEGLRVRAVRQIWPSSN